MRFILCAASWHVLDLWCLDACYQQICCLFSAALAHTQHGHLEVVRELLTCLREKEQTPGAYKSYDQNMAGMSPLHLVVDNDKVPEDK